MYPELILTTPNMENISVGIIGMGAMGKMYAKKISEGGWR
jgi:prephenate dehydrogenase